MPISRPTISLAGPQNITMTKPDDRERILTQTRISRWHGPHMPMCAVVPSNSTIGSRTAGLASCRKVLRYGFAAMSIRNLGPLADAKGHVLIQIRDLDQTVIGNPAHDLICLGLSLASAARGSDLPGVTTARILEELVAGYLAALTANSRRTKIDRNPPKSIRMLLEQSTRRRWRHFTKERLNSLKPTIPLGRRFWNLRPAERMASSQMFASNSVRRRHFTWGSSEGRSHRAAGCRLLDEGMQFAWAASYAANADRSRKRFEPVPSRRQGRSDRCGPRRRRWGPRDNAIRVVTGARALSPNLGQRMMAAKLLEKSVVVRELMPLDPKVEVSELSRTEAINLARYLAGVVARAHGRQMTSSQQREWRSDLSKNHKGSLEAPSWLWASVVELLGLHKAAYLNHCRRFALSEAA